MKKIFSLVFAAIIIIGGVSYADAKAVKAELFYDGMTVRTVATPAAVPHGGIDPLYSVTNGVDGQFGITAVAPGDPGYHGGRWAVYTVTFNPGVTPYLLTSDEAVFVAEGAGDVTITRAPELDNRCPVQE